MYEFQEETCKFIWDRKKNDVRSTRENRPPFAAGPIVDLQQQTTAGRRKHKLLPPLYRCSCKEPRVVLYTSFLKTGGHLLLFIHRAHHQKSLDFIPKVIRLMHWEYSRAWDWHRRR